MQMKKTNHMLGGRGYIGKQKVWRTEDDGFNQRCEWGKDMLRENKMTDLLCLSGYSERLK